MISKSDSLSKAVLLVLVTMGASVAVLKYSNVYNKETDTVEIITSKPTSTVKTNQVTTPDNSYENFVEDNNDSNYYDDNNGFER